MALSGVNEKDRAKPSSLKLTDVNECFGSDLGFFVPLPDVCLKDLPTLTNPEDSLCMSREATSPVRGMVSSPRFNSPVNLPMNSELLLEQRRHVLVDVTLLTGNKKRPHHDEPPSSNNSQCFTPLSSVGKDDCTQRAKKHRRSASTSTIGSTEFLQSFEFASTGGLMANEELLPPESSFSQDSSSFAVDFDDKLSTML